MAATVPPGRRIASPVPPSGCQEGGVLEGEGLQVHSLERAERLGGVELRPIDESMHRVRHIEARRAVLRQVQQRTTTIPVAVAGMVEVNKESLSLPLYVLLISFLSPIRADVRTYVHSARRVSRKHDTQSLHPLASHAQVGGGRYAHMALTHSLTSAPRQQPSPKGERVIGRW